MTAVSKTQPLDPYSARWINKPAHVELGETTVSLTTEAQTDLWQRTYYGFRIANAPALLWESNKNFTFSTQVEFAYKQQFDQCGIILYLDENNWFKASIEHEVASDARLGSVVTNNGYSDWATTDIQPVNKAQYRLSRRGPDFLVEYAINESPFRQMRVFHIAQLGDTTAEMGLSDALPTTGKILNFGVYACSPGDSAFTASFNDLNIQANIWKPHPT